MYILYSPIDQKVRVSKVSVNNLISIKVDLEVVAKKYSLKKLFRKISKNSGENT